MFSEVWALRSQDIGQLVIMGYTHKNVSLYPQQ